MFNVEELLERHWYEKGSIDETFVTAINPKNFAGLAFVLREP